MVKQQAIVLAVSVLFSGYVHSACVPVQGKITNNFIADGNTLGVVAMEYGGQRQCHKAQMRAGRCAATRDASVRYSFDPFDIL